MRMTFATRKCKKTKIPVFAHNLFSFDFFFVVKGIGLCVLQTKQQSIGLSNLTIVQYASIGTQVKFIDTIKYYEQSLSSRAKNANDVEKTNTRQTCRKFMENNATYSLIFTLCLTKIQIGCGLFVWRKGSYSLWKDKNAWISELCPQTRFFHQNQIL